MASFISLRSGTTEFVVNVDNIDYIRASGTKCVIYFGRDNAINVDHSAYEVIRKALDANKTMGEEATRGIEAARQIVERMSPEDRGLL